MKRATTRAKIAEAHVAEVVTTTRAPAAWFDVAAVVDDALSAARALLRLGKKCPRSLLRSRGMCCGPHSGTRLPLVPPRTARHADACGAVVTAQGAQLPLASTIVRPTLHPQDTTADRAWKCDTERGAKVEAQVVVVHRTVAEHEVCHGWGKHHVAVADATRHWKRRRVAGFGTQELRHTGPTQAALMSTSCRDDELQALVLAHGTRANRRCRYYLPASGVAHTAQGARPGAPAAVKLHRASDAAAGPWLRWLWRGVADDRG